MHTELEWIIGAVTAILLPTLIWCWRLHGMVKRTLEMHMDPDKHGFGTQKTNDLLEKNMMNGREMHQASIHALQSLDATIDRLGTFIEKLIEVQTGLPVLPPRRKA